MKKHYRVWQTSVEFVDVYADSSSAAVTKAMELPPSSALNSPWEITDAGGVEVEEVHDDLVA